MSQDEKRRGGTPRTRADWESETLGPTVKANPERSVPFTTVKCSDT